MTDTALIAVFSLAFGALTWLLTISYFIGRHSARVDSLEGNVKKVEQNFQTIFSKLDFLAQHLPYHCSQVDRLARIEARMDARSESDHTRDCGPGGG